MPPCSASSRFFVNEDLRTFQDSKRLNLQEIKENRSDLLLENPSGGSGTGKYQSKKQLPFH